MNSRTYLAALPVFEADLREGNGSLSGGRTGCRLFGFSLVLGGAALPAGSSSEAQDGTLAKVVGRSCTKIGD